MRISYSDAAQMELLYAIKNIRTESELNELKLALSHFFADKAQKELDELWDSGVLDQKKLDELKESLLSFAIFEIRQLVNSRSREVLVPFYPDVLMEGMNYAFLQKARTIRYGKIFCKGSLCCAYLMKY